MEMEKKLYMAGGVGIGWGQKIKEATGSFIIKVDNIRHTELHGL
jgi:hypothetical protein